MSKNRDWTGPRNPKWNGGQSSTWSGYILVKCPDHPNSRKSGYILEHRLVMSLHLERSLEEHELVHHINEDKTDNRLENLELIDREAHTRYHSTGPKNGTWVDIEPKACIGCGEQFTKVWKANQKRDQYCSRKCMHQSMVGESGANTRLSDSDIEMIRRTWAEERLSQRDLAKRFNLSKTHVGRILRNECR